MDLQLPLLRCIKGRAPSFHRTLSALGELPAFFYGAIEVGGTHVRTYFEKQSNNERPRVHIREMILRDMAKRYLQQHHFAIEDEELAVADEPLSALLVRCGPVQIRILKGRNGLIPGCGDSISRTRFYNQKPSAYIDPRTRQIRTTKLNLVMLWDFGRAFDISDVWICCPLRAGVRSSNVLIQWHEVIPHPVFSAEQPPAPTEEARIKAEDDLEQLLRENEAEQTEDREEQA